ncbi:MAG: pyridoxal phosphate-dependent aminotransferase [Lachnospiraceae bacterium]
MISERMFKVGKAKSIIRIMYDWGCERAAKIGSENVFDFSLGNPNIDTPKEVSDRIVHLIQNENSVAIHGYTNLQGDFQVREKIAAYLNQKFHTCLEKENIYMTGGATAALRICFMALCNPGDEIIIFAPFFPEYLSCAEEALATPCIIPAKTDDFQIDLNKLEKAINEKTKAIVVNSPNNPSGAVYSRETIENLASLLYKKEEAYGHPIFLISDEPYREIVYDEIEVPYVMNYYKDTLTCYSFSKSLSLPGERIGYLVIPPDIADYESLFVAICGGARYVGQVNAPSLFQRIAGDCIGALSDISIYKKNRDLLYEALKSYGYHCVEPQGAFYLFVKAFGEDAVDFCERAKKYNLVLLPGNDFGCPGYVRLAYCVSTHTIIKSLPSFEKLAKEYKEI